MADKIITVTVQSIVTNDTLDSYNNYSDIDGSLGSMTVQESIDGKEVALSNGEVHEVTTKPVGTTNGEFSAVVSNSVQVDTGAAGDVMYDTDLAGNDFTDWTSPTGDVVTYLNGRIQITNPDGVSAAAITINNSASFNPPYNVSFDPTHTYQANMYVYGADPIYLTVTSDTYWTYPPSGSTGNEKVQTVIGLCAPVMTGQSAGSMQVGFGGDGSAFNNDTIEIERIIITDLGVL